jgi:hypothetical protein
MTADSRQQAAGSRQQAAIGRQQTTGSRQQTADRDALLESALQLEHVLQATTHLP